MGSVKYHPAIYQSCHVTGGHYKESIPGSHFTPPGTWLCRNVTFPKWNSPSAKPIYIDRRHMRIGHLKGSTPNGVRYEMTTNRAHSVLLAREEGKLLITQCNNWGFYLADSGDHLHCAETEEKSPMYRPLPHPPPPSNCYVSPSSVLSYIPLPVF
jgi:hypothetical protein